MTLENKTVAMYYERFNGFTYAVEKYRKTEKLSPKSRLNMVFLDMLLEKVGIKNFSDKELARALRELEGNN